MLEEAFTIMSRARAQIRRPLDSRAAGDDLAWSTPTARSLGIVRSPDAPVFGIDVSLQKARTAAFFSGARRGVGPARATRARDVRAFVPDDPRTSSPIRPR